MNWRCKKKNAEKQAMEDNKSDIGWGSQDPLLRAG